MKKIKELQAIIDGITEPLILIDQNFDIKRVNQATLNFTGEVAYKDLTKQNATLSFTVVKIYVPIVPFSIIKSNNLITLNF